MLTSIPPVEIRDGSVAIAGRPILRGIDLTVRPGEFVALMGANGSGKSTLVRAMTGLRSLAAGSMSLFGTPIGSFRDWQRVGFVPQRSGASTGVPASVREVVASGRLTRRRLLRPLTRADRQAIDDAIEVVGLSDLAHRGVSHLSGGQQQRALIARALAGEPDLFFLDEPTAGVDLPSQQALADTLHLLSGPRCDDRAGRTRARPDGSPDRPRGGDARRAGRVRRPSAGRARGAPPGLRRRTHPPLLDRAPRPCAARRLAAGRGAHLMDLFELPFMQRALLAAVFTGLAAPAVGTYLVQRRLALMGDGIGHVAVTGVALGLLTGMSPTWTAVVVAVLGAMLIEVIRERGHANGDVALALLFYGGLAGGVLLTGLGGESASRLQGYLFGSILTISAADVWVTIGLALVVVLISLGLAPQLFAVAQDQEFARVAGLNVRFYNLLVAVLAAVSVTVAMRTVGLLLVSALMVVPVATSQQVTRSFRATLGLAMLLGTVASLGGLVDLGVRVVPRDGGCRADDRAAVPGRFRAHLAGRGAAAPPAADARAVPGGRAGRRGDRGDAPARPRRELRPPGRSARRPRRLCPRRPPARAPREAL